MERALAVVEASNRAKELVREAGELAAGVDADLVLLHVTTEEVFERNTEALAETDLDVDYGIGSARDTGRQLAREVGHEVLGPDAAFTPIGRVGDPLETILDVAAERDCDHVFVHGRKRSPAGKAIFGDVTQSVILDFDGPVTVMTSEETVED